MSSSSAMDQNDIRGPSSLSGWRLKWYVIIFEADTKAGQRFDMLLIWAILLSLVVIMLDSVKALHTEYENAFDLVEWAFTLVFTAEYLARLACSPHPLRYAKSFLGVIDLISILPSYIALFVPEAYVLLDVRILRLLRLFRILKMTGYVDELQWLMMAVADSRRKIGVFISIIFTLVVILGSLLYVIEGPEHGFTSVPISVYWAITTITTVGFGDITPHTDLGRLIASMMMMFGWGILAVPTGIVSAEMIAQRAVRKTLSETTTRTCHGCTTEGHSAEARFCLHCGEQLTEYFGEAPPLTPRIAFASALIYMINADGKIEPHEISRLVTALKNDRELLELANRYTKLNSIDEFLVNCQEVLDKEQQLSVLVNLYDAILSTREPALQELELFKRFMQTFSYDEQQFEPYFHSIAVKNNRALFRH
ncbi:MAG: ion transporter [Burkholderiales bacterium]|nr:ion transporter [Burkholderiales bacterium]